MTSLKSDARKVRTLAGLAIVAGLAAGTASSAAEQALFKSRRLTPPSEYTRHIEGPAVDAAGILYVPNFRTDGTIGKLKPGATRSELFAELPMGSIGSGIRFDRDGRMYVADFKNHNVFVFEPGQTVPEPYFHSDDMFHQPNDLAIAADGTLYASDPDFEGHTGQIWRITRGPDGKGRGEVMSAEPKPGVANGKLGVTNGIDLSPDGTTLYIGESNTREIWAFTLQDAKLVAPHRVVGFAGPKGSELDGLRTDRDGNIFVARLGNGTVAMVTPLGKVVREIPVLGKNPSNLTFGGPDGKTVFVTQVAGRFIEAFRVGRAGREPCLQVGGAAC